jgi:hypothetical protein
MTCLFGSLMGRISLLFKISVKKIIFRCLLLYSYLMEEEQLYAWWYNKHKYIVELTSLYPG